MRNLKFISCVFLSSLAVFSAPAYSQALKNGDFAKGKANWQGDGELVTLTPDGKVQSAEIPGSDLRLTLSSSGNLQDTQTSGSTRALKIDLQKFKWTSISQGLFPHSKDNSISVSIMVKAMPNFVRLEESAEYSRVDFKEGREYEWSAEVSPKCDFLVRVHDTTWHYRPLSLKPFGEWKTFHFDFSDLEARSRSLALAFPPGSGSILIKYAK